MATSRSADDEEGTVFALGTRWGLRIMGVLAAALLAALSSVALAGCGSSAIATQESKPATMSVTDQAGRQVTVPDPIQDVYCTSPMGTNLMYSLAPEMLVGWNITPTALEKKYIPEQYRDITGLGGWYGKNTTGNVEEIIKRAPDVVIDLGDLDAARISEIERISGLLNLPVVMANGDLTASGDTLRYIGELLGVEDRAGELADYCDGVIREAQKIAGGLSAEDKVRVYYAEGMKGLNTDPAGSMHTEVLELVGGQNVAQVTTESDYGMAPVSLEQVLAWNPEVILVASDPAEESNVYEQITTGAEWATVTAVKNKQVYQIPRGPFDWFDRPPCLARIIGVKWLGNLLYPDLYSYDIKQEVKDFYNVFYHMELTDAQLAELMVHAVRTH
jgi:iron complex transport system substrate-binding protein